MCVRTCHCICPTAGYGGYGTRRLCILSDEICLEPVTELGKYYLSVKKTRIVQLFLEILCPPLLPL